MGKLYFQKNAYKVLFVAFRGEISATVKQQFWKILKYCRLTVAELSQFVESSKFTSIQTGRAWPTHGRMEKPPNLFTRETLYHILFFPRAARAPRARAPPSDLRQINSAILKVPDGALSC